MLGYSDFVFNKAFEMYGRVWLSKLIKNCPVVAEFVGTITFSTSLCVRFHKKMKSERVARQLYLKCKWQRLEKSIAVLFLWIKCSRNEIANRPYGLPSWCCRKWRDYKRTMAFITVCYFPEREISFFSQFLKTQMWLLLAFCLPAKLTCYWMVSVFAIFCSWMLIMLLIKDYRRISSKVACIILNI